MNIEEEIQKLLKEIGTGKMSSTPYDTAWVARLRDIDSNLSNQALQWICDNQLPDGSWGTEQPMYYHDRVICTLSAMIALTYRGRRAQDKLQIQKGLEALSNIAAGATEGLRADPNGASVGFEVIVPTLVAEAERLGLISQHKESILGKLSHLREIKMDKLKGIKISKFVTVAHSSEMTGKDKINLLDIENLQEINGSVGNSPSATAHFILYAKPGDSSALTYLYSLVNNGDRGFPTLSPIEIFEKVWVLWNITLTSLYKTNKQIKALCDSHLDYLEKHWKPGKGLGFSKYFSLTDGDDTSVGYEILSKCGRNPELNAVLQYEEEHWFRCFHLEANPSVDVNIHALGALRQADYDKNHPTIKKIISFIRSMRQPGNFWFDKWHVSPYYTTAHLVILARGYDDSLCQESVDWILRTQKSDGSWGFYKFSTAEETAYCLQALIIWERHGGKIRKGAIEQAKVWLSHNYKAPYPPLWIDKSLYCPETLVRASILSALALAEEHLS
jgi:halimadienyl-diphosphate synthase